MIFNNLLPLVIFSDNSWVLLIQTYLFLNSLTSWGNSWEQGKPARKASEAPRAPPGRASTQRRSRKLVTQHLAGPLAQKGFACGWAEPLATRGDRRWPALCRGDFKRERQGCPPPSLRRGISWAFKESEEVSAAASLSPSTQPEEETEYPWGKRSKPLLPKTPPNFLFKLLWFVIK